LGVLFIERLLKNSVKKIYFLLGSQGDLLGGLSNSINPSKLRRRKRSPRAVRFLHKQQLKYFFVDFKERQFRHIYRKILGHKRAHIYKTLLQCIVRQFEARLDSFFV